jgi:enoyl-CoA hydratase/carnithine racemase
MPGPVTTEIRTHNDARIATVTLDNERKLNIVNTPILHALIDAVTTLHSDEDLRCLVLDAAGDRAWFGGADITEMVTLDQDGAEAFITLLHDFCQALRDLPVPVIARIDGYTLGAGLEIAAACDLRLATDRSSFGMPEVNVGIPSVIEAALLPTLIGWGQTKRLVYLGENIDAAEALRIGMVEKVVAPQDLDAALDAWLDSLANAGPRAIRLQKELIRDWERLPRAEAIQAGIRTFREGFATDEPRAAMQAFIDRKR